MLRLINLNHPKLIGAVELENTETCALKDKVEELRARLPSFNRQTPKIITCSGMDKWCERKFSQNITTITKMGELCLRPEDFGAEGRGGRRRLFWQGAEGSGSGSGSGSGPTSTVAGRTSGACTP